jgi:hypothetical protein
MLVFIDDSGDPGFKIEKGSSTHFVIAMVCFDDELEAEKTAVAIKELRRKLRIKDHEEFKFFKSCRDHRIDFLKTVNKFDFRVKCLIVDKEKIYSPELKSNKNSFYAYFIKEALKNNNKTILEAKIRIDGSGNRIFRNNFVTYLRKELNSEERSIIKNCQLVDSSSNVLIQLADMIAGSINRSENKDKKDSSDYKSVIKKKIEDEWSFR